MGNCQPEGVSARAPATRLTAEQLRSIRALQRAREAREAREPRRVSLEGQLAVGPLAAATHIVIAPDPARPGARQRPLCLTIDPDANTAVECPNCQRHRRRQNATSCTLCMEHLVNFTLMLLVLLAFVVILVLIFKSNKVKVRWPRMKIVKAGAAGGDDIFNDEFSKGKGGDGPPKY